MAEQIYAGFVDTGSDNFRLATLDLSDASLTAVGNLQDISTLVGAAPAGFGFIESGGSIYAGFVDGGARRFQLATIDLSDGSLTAVGSQQNIFTLVGSSPQGMGFIESGGTVYVGFVDNGSDMFRLASVDLSDGSLTGVGSLQNISTLVGSNPRGTGLIESGGSNYAGFVDLGNNMFRLATLDLSNATLTAVGSQQDISTLVGNNPAGFGLIGSGGTVYAGFVDQTSDNERFRLATVTLTDATLTGVGSQQDIGTLVGSVPTGVGFIAVTVNEAPSFTDDTGDAISGTAGTAITDVTVPEADGEPAPTYAVHNNSLPAGLDFDTATRVISGTPSAAGSGTITIRATNSEGTADWTVDYTFAANVSAPSFADDTGDPISGETGSAIMTVTIPRADGMPDPTYSQVGATPSGLTVTLPTTGSDGSITGTPDTAGSGTITVRATNSEGTDDWTVAYAFTDAALSLARFSATGTIHMQFRAHAGAYTRGDGQVNLWASTDWTNDGTAGQVGTLEEGSAAVSGISGNAPTIARMAKWSNANRLIINTDGAGDIGSLFDDGDEPYRVTLVVETGAGQDMFTVAPESSGHGASFIDWRQDDGDLTAAMYAMLDGLADGEEFILALHQGTASYTPPAAPSFADDTGTPIMGTVGTPIPSVTVPEATGSPTPTYSATSLPATGVSFDPATRVLSFDENAIVVSTGTIRITATNSEGTDEWTVVYSFGAAAVAPFFSDQFGDPIEVLVGETIASITIPRAAGGNPDPTYSLVGAAPSGLIVTLPTTVSDGSITGTPNVAGSGFITVRATNSQGHADWSVRYSIAAEGMKVAVTPSASTVPSGESVTLDGEAYGDLISVDRAGGDRSEVELWLLSQASDGIWILRERGGLSGLAGFSRPLSIATRGGAFFIMDRFGEDIFRITNLDTGAGAELGTESDSDLDIPQGSTFLGDVYWIIDEQANDLWSWADVVTSPDGGVQNGTVTLTGAPRGMTARAGSLVVLAVDGRDWQLLRIDNPSTGASTALATFSSVPSVPISGVPEAVENYRGSLWLFTSDSELVEITDLDGTPALQHRADFSNADLSDPVGLTEYPVPASYAWASDNGGTFGDAAALSTTWDSTGVAVGTDVTLTLTVTDEGGGTASHSVMVSVAAAAAVAPSFADDTGDTINASVGDTIPDVVVPEASGNPLPTYAVVGSLPTGVSFDTGTRTLSFDGSAIEVGFGTIRIRATNSEGSDDWTVAYVFGAMATAPSFADDTGDPIVSPAGTAITDVMVPVASGNPAPTYAVVGSLPGGLNFNANTRIISGTPDARGTGTIRIRATNSAGSDDWTVDYTFTVDHEVSAGSVSWSFAVPQPSVDHDQVHEISARVTSWTFDVSEPNLSHVKAAGSASWSFAVPEPSTGLDQAHEISAGSASWTFAVSEPEADQVRRRDAGSALWSFEAVQPSVTAGGQMSVSARSASWEFEVPEPSVRRIRSHAVDAGSASWEFAAAQPSISAGGVISVSARSASWLFALPEPSVTHRRAHGADAGGAQWSFAAVEPSVSRNRFRNAGQASWEFEAVRPSVTSGSTMGVIAGSASWDFSIAEPTVRHLNAYAVDADSAEFEFSVGSVGTAAALMRDADGVDWAFSIPAVQIGTLPGTPDEPEFGRFGQTEVTVSVNVPSSDVPLLRLEYSLDGGPWVGVPVGILQTVVFVLTGLEPGRRYRLRVRGVNEVGSGIPVSMGFETLPVRASSPPLFPQIVPASDGTLTATWRAPSDDGGGEITRYEVNLCDESGADCGWEDAGNDLKRTFRGLGIGHRYELRVRAVNAGGTSDDSERVSGVPFRKTTRTIPAGSVLPLTGAARQSMIVRLAGNDCRVRVWWQPSDESWWGSIEIPANTAFVNGRRLGLNCGLLDRLEWRLGGNLVMRAAGGSGGEPDRNSLRMGTHELRWEPQS